jgi:hypothetical protein
VSRRPEVTDLDVHYNHAGVAIVASSGDGDYGVSYPAASQYVTSVGGTALVRDSSTRGWSESVWHNQYGGPGSGCSVYEPKPSFQKDTGCAKRSVADVSAVSDPATGVAVYQTYGGGGWAVYGGTSAASTDHRGRVRDRRHPGAGHLSELVPVRGARLALRRDRRRQRLVQPGVPLHRGHRLRRPYRSRHPARPGRLLLRAAR